jgi:hypothetical protein
MWVLVVRPADMVRSTEPAHHFSLYISRDSSLAPVVAFGAAWPTPAAAAIALTHIHSPALALPFFEVRFDPTTLSRSIPTLVSKLVASLMSSSEIGGLPMVASVIYDIALPPAWSSVGRVTHSGAPCGTDAASTSPLCPSTAVWLM